MKLPKSINNSDAHHSIIGKDLLSVENIHKHSPEDPTFDLACIGFLFPLRRRGHYQIIFCSSKPSCYRSLFSALVLRTAVRLFPLPCSVFWSGKLDQGEPERRREHRVDFLSQHMDGCALIRLMSESRDKRKQSEKANVPTLIGTRDRKKDLKQWNHRLTPGTNPW